jgi:hypothetical protein
MPMRSRTGPDMYFLRFVSNAAFTAAALPTAASAAAAVLERQQ